MTVADALINSLKVVSCAGVAEAERHGWPLTGVTQHHFTLSQTIVHV